MSSDPLQRPPIRPAPLSVVLLSHRAATDLSKRLDDWSLALDALGQDYEILLAQDATAVATTDTALLDRAPRVRVLRHFREPGVGSDLAAGLAAARFPLVLHADVTDGTCPDDVKLLLDKIDAVDLVSTHRVNTPEPVWLRGLGAIYRGLSRFLLGMPLEPLPGWPGWSGCARRLLVRLLFGVRLHGAESSFRLYRRAVFDRIPIQSTGPFVFVEVMAKANFLGAVMDEVVIRSPATPLADWKAALPDARRVLTHPEFTAPAEPLKT